MPLFVNGEWFNPGLKLDEQPPAHKKFKKQYDAFIHSTQPFRWPVTLKVGRANKIKTDSRGNPIPPPSDNLSWKAVINTPDGADTWVYQPSIPEKRDGEYRFRKLGEWVRGSLIIHKTQMDKLFYFMKKAPYLGGTLVHHDPAADAMKRAAKREVEAKLYYLIYNRESELYQNAPLMRDIAKSWGVKRVGDMTLAEVQEALFEKVTQGDDIRTRGPQAFIDSVADRETVSRQAKAQDAIEKGLVVFNDEEMAWKYKSLGVETANICKLDASDKGKELEALLDYLSRSPEDEARVLHAAKTGRLTEFNERDIDGMDWSEIRSEVRVAGIKSAMSGRTKDDVKDDLREWLRYKKHV